MTDAGFDSRGRPRSYTRPKRMTVEIFWSRVDKGDGTGCWIYTGPLRAGYGYVGRWGNAHVVAWKLLVGPVPEGMQLDHVAARGCTSRRCCNPAHLEPVPPRENILRGSSPSAINARKTHCPKGHPYSEENTELSPQGRRKCRTCRPEESKRSYAARKARAA